MMSSASESTHLAGSSDRQGGDLLGYRWVLAGRVQGVGFRPFIYRLAQTFGICGYAQNQSGQVVVVGEGPALLLRQFWEPLVSMLDDASQSVGRRAADFHASLAHGLLAQARAVRSERGAVDIGLCGGVFQNRLLTEQAIDLLRDDGFAVHLAEQLPCNDGGLAFGQLIEAGVRQ